MDIKSFKVITDTLGRVGVGKGDGSGGDRGSAAGYVGLETDRVDLRLVGKVHRDNLVPDKVGTVCRINTFEMNTSRMTYPGATSAGILKVQLGFLKSLSVAHSVPS
jgi:hypothetical protein